MFRIISFATKLSLVATSVVRLAPAADGAALDAASGGAAVGGPARMPVHETALIERVCCQ
jgi:hypothetical protein